MKPKKQGLGRGLDAILIDSSAEEAEAGVTMVRLSEVEPNSDQPRKRFDETELAALADSVSQYGILQPITVREHDGMYQIVTGERRWRAARMAGLSEVPVIVITADDRKAAELALIENIQRSDLDPIEEARGFASLIEEYGLTQEDAAKRIGRSRAAVTNSLRLLALPDEVRDLVARGELSVGHAKVILGLPTADKIILAAKQVVMRGLSVRETEKLVHVLSAPETSKAPVIVRDVDHTRALELRAQKQLGRTVKISEKGKNHTVSIGYSDNKDLEELLVLLCGESFIDSI